MQHTLTPQVTGAGGGNGGNGTDVGTAGVFSIGGNAVNPAGTGGSAVKTRSDYESALKERGAQG